MLSVDAVELYYGASHALRRVSLTAKTGEVTCILGRNGVGKTSLLRAIFGLNPIRSGRITWEERDLTALSPHERARAPPSHARPPSSPPSPSSRRAAKSSRAFRCWRT